MRKYIINNDRYSSQPDEVTIDELRKMCDEMGWKTQLEECKYVWENFYRIYDSVSKQMVAIEKKAY